MGIVSVFEKLKSLCVELCGLIFARTAPDLPILGGEFRQTLWRLGMTAAEAQAHCEIISESHY